MLSRQRGVAPASDAGAKDAALRNGWAAELLQEVHRVPDLLRFALLHSEPGRTRYALLLETHALGCLARP